MESKLRKWKNRRDILKLLEYRENNAEASKFFKQHSQFTDSLIKRLGLEHELEGHHGCVNCLQWSPDGKHLASGSDDTNIILWDPFRHRQLQIIPTTHIGNIFSVKFLGSNEIATAAGDCRVLVQSIPEAMAKSPPLLECSCHVNRVKRLATSPIEPTLFWSAAEDGLVIQYDLREQHDCFQQSQTKVLVDLSNNFGEVKCIAVNPTKPHYMAVGANDCYVRLYDRRMLKTLTLGQTNQGDFRKTVEREPLDPNCVQYYAAGHLAYSNASITNFKLAATYISFNSAGSEMLVNMGGEQIYLFDVNNSRHINELLTPQMNGRTRRSSVYKDCCHPGGNGFSNKARGRDPTDENCVCYYMQRAYKCYWRRWKGDFYSAARDYLYVTQVWPEQRQAFVGLVKAAIQLKWEDAAEKWLDYFCASHPDCVGSQQVEELHENLKTLRRVYPKKERDNENPDRKERFLRNVDEAEQRRRLDSNDYEARFLGHCNTTTDIKEANFLGEDGNYICAGSDEGIIFIWEKKHASIVTALIGDVSIVNCIQPHPSACFIASSGIDPAVKLWSPMPEDGNVNSRVVRDVDDVVEANQKRMSMDPFETMLINMGYRIPGFDVEPAFQEVPSCRPF